MHENLQQDLKTGRFVKIYETPEAFENAIESYLEHIKTQVTEVHLASGPIFKPMLPTICGLAGYLRIDQDTLKNYERRPGYDVIYKRFRSLAEDTILQRALSGEYAPAVSIFFLKNAFNYRDSIDVNAQIPVSYKPILSAEEILDKISDKQIQGLLGDEEES